ncbi:Spermidine synthase [Poriferisphaera corsica]|uniref:Polyamine aminopropyltransferase n=1 Tax=Poriferisphaera corsica TaxID=2528020 RepID=A0A517YT43_9BACT|nr:spermidine synthase [Poriferisphaera corsica]QDU33400.1 Spermidine synthase [Poriferisphaera corsica]
MPGSRVNADVWVNEYISEYDVRQFGVDEILYAAKTQYQNVQIVRSGQDRLALVLDGKWQSDTTDEFMYHEPLVHVACVNHGTPKKVLVLGGGEGATVREVLKWKDIEKVVMVDIDGEVVDACIKHLEPMHQGCFDDPRMELVIGDALNYLDDSENEWDIIISDLSDPIEEGPSFPLFTKEYFEKCRRAMKADGVLVVQAGPVSPTEVVCHARLHNTIAAVFESTASYSTQTTSYGAPWSYVLGSAKQMDRLPNPERVDSLLSERTTGEFRMFDGVACLGLMGIGKHIRHAIETETTIYTQSDPRKFFGTGVASQS